MGRPKGSKNKTPVQTYRDENNNLVLASEPFVPSERFKQGEPPPPPCEDKGNIRALLQGLSITLKSPDKVTAQKVLDWEISYLNYIYDSDVYLIPDYLGWCSFVGITRRQMDYIQSTKMRKESVIDGNGEEIFASASELIQKAKDDFMAIKSQLGLSGKMPPLLYVGMMNNGGGWSPKQEIQISTTNNPVATASNAELDKILADYEPDKNSKTIDGNFQEIT